MEDWSKHKPAIFQYKGKYIKNWFSNMESSPIVFNPKNNIIYPTVEHFYQAMKSNNTLEHALIAKADTPYEAKKMGKSVKDPFGYLVADVIDIVGISSDLLLTTKLFVMSVGLCEKFKIKEWRDKLLATGEEQIIEWNNWGDILWGVDTKTNKGQNWLGKLLMNLRQSIKAGRETYILF